MFSQMPNRGNAGALVAKQKNPIMAESIYSMVGSGTTKEKPFHCGLPLLAKMAANLAFSVTVCWVYL